MEDIPPSYDNINASVLDLLVPYLNTASLVNLCLVSKAYYATFIPHLWGSPASHFVQVANESSRTTNGINFANLQVTGSQNDLVYVALTRFKRILKRARHSTRMLCHTLHLPPALSEIYGGPNSTWLREVLDWLPGLQSLCLSGLPFFDHDSLVAVDQSRSSVGSPGLNDEDFRQYPAKLLLATKEPNVTWVGLSLLIPHLPHLVYLDLSYTSPARNANVLQSLDALTHLQVLKLRGIGLKDPELEILANVIGLRVRLLDIAENLLTDMAVRSLLQACFWLPSTPAALGQVPGNRYSRQDFESWPVGLPPPPDSLSLDTIRTVELDEALLTQLTNPLTGRLAFEDIPHGGITHLYISGNPGISIESIRSILDLGRLHVLDAGNISALTAVDLHVLSARKQSAGQRDIDRAKSITASHKNIRGFITRHKNRPASLNSTDSGPFAEAGEFDEEEDFLKMPGAQKLIPVLQEKAGKNLTHLRIDHAVATAVLDTTKELKEKEKVIAGRVELPGVLSRAVEVDAKTRQVVEAPGSRSYAAEMPAESSVFEMDATPAAPRAELPGDIIHFAISPPIGDQPQSQTPEITSPIRGEGAMAPEVVNHPDEHNASDEEEIVLNATGSGVRRNITSATNSTVSTLQSMNSVSSRSDASPVTRPEPLRLRKSIKPDSIVAQKTLHSKNVYDAEIKKLTNVRPKGPSIKLHPSFLPNLRTLVLTNVPREVPSTSTVIERLKAYITACASEARLAVLKARTDYSLPPGRARQDAERQHAQTLFALQAIVLEISADTDQAQQRGWKPVRQPMHISKSSTGDADSEALWSAADNDFSFFGEEGEESNECGIYDQEPDKYYPTTIPFDDKIFVSSNDQPNSFDSSNNLLSPRVSTPSSAVYGSFGSPINSRGQINRNGTLMQSPRNLPLGRNRRTSNELNRGRNSPTVSDLKLPQRLNTTSPYIEMPGTIPAIRPQPPTSYPTSQPVQSPAPEPTQMVDVVAVLAQWRRERKAVYQEELLKHRRSSSSTSASGSLGRLADMETFVEGYWSGEVKVVRTSPRNVPKGKMERQGNVDVFGNYYEGGYLYP